MRLPRIPGTVDREHVLCLDLTIKQANACARACGVANDAFEIRPSRSL